MASRSSSGTQDGAEAVAAASTSAASPREAPATGGVAAGGGEKPPSPTSTPTSSRSATEGKGAAADEEAHEKKQMQMRLRYLDMNIEWARTCWARREWQLCDAAEEGRLSDVQRLLSMSPPTGINYITGDGLNPLMKAALKGHEDVVSFLLQRGADANAPIIDGRSALHCAATWNPSTRWIQLLVGAGADVNQRGKNGETPLHYAAESDNEEAVRALLAAGARRDLKPWQGPWEGKTPFDMARSPHIQDLLRLQRQE